MKQLDKVELFVCSEDATQPIGFADEVEVWTEGGSSHLILRGVNGVDKDAVLQAENECLRRDVEFYKKLWQARGGGATKPTITESQFDRAVSGVWGDEGSGPTDSNGYARGFLFRLGINVIPDPEPTDEELLAGIIRNIDDWQSITSPELLAKYLSTAGVTPPGEDDA